MNQTKQTILFKKYPNLFEKTNQKWPIELFGIQCDDGWFDIIDRFLEELTSLDNHKKLRVIQIKEKFGGLRLYCINLSESSNLTSEYFKLHDKYEKLSYNICEKCGSDGNLFETEHGFLYVSCLEHKKDINDKMVDPNMFLIRIKG